MAGGPLQPCSSVPDTNGKIFPGIYVGSTNSRQIMGLQVMASLDGDSEWELLWYLPATQPTGTLKLALVALADATTGVARVNPKWASVALTENPDTITLNAEGAQSITWSAGQDDDFKLTTITLDADTAVDGEMLFMHMTFETASWTLAAVSTWLAFLIWE